MTKLDKSFKTNNFKIKNVCLIQFQFSRIKINIILDSNLVNINYLFIWPTLKLISLGLMKF